MPTITATGAALRWLTQANVTLADPVTHPGLRITKSAYFVVTATHRVDRHGVFISITQEAATSAARRAIDLPRAIERVLRNRRARVDIPVSMRHIRVQRMGDDVHVSLA